MHSSAVSSKICGAALSSACPMCGEETPAGDAEVSLAAVSRDNLRVATFIMMV